MRLYINDYSLICSLGDKKDLISNKLFSSKINENSQFQLVDSQKTPIMKVDGNLPNLSELKSMYRSRNNQLLLKILIDLKSTIDTFIEKYGNSRIGVVLGTSTSGIDEGIDAIRKKEGESLPSDYFYEVQELGSPSEFVKNYLGLDSFAYTVSTACSSGSRSFIEGRRLIEMGVCDVVIVGGSDSLNPLTLNGFHSLEAISTERTNPMSRNRKGINIGEGAALFIMSKEPSKLLFLGGGESSDAHHISSPDPEGKGAIRAMQNALIDAGIEASEIDYINLHGTGTAKNDSMESFAVNQLFQNQPYVSSTKPMIGHTLGAAGALEAAFCFLTLENEKGFLPIHFYDGEYDSELPRLNLVLENKKISPKTCMSNSYAFGGNNVSLILGMV